MKRLWIGFLLIIAVPARADGLPTPEAARQLADKIMEAETVIRIALSH